MDPHRIFVELSARCGKMVTRFHSSCGLLAQFSAKGTTLSDAEPDVTKPLRDASGRVTLSSYVHPSEIRAWAEEQPAEFRFPFLLIASGFDRLWSANRILKAPLSRAERFLRCAADMDQALESAGRMQVPELIRIAQGLVTGLRPQCDQLAAQCFDVFQSQQAQKLEKARTRERKTRVAESSLKSLKRLLGGTFVPPTLTERVVAMNQFWSEQLLLNRPASAEANPFDRGRIGPSEILPARWFRFDVIDKTTGDSWDLRVPSLSADLASAHLWRLGFVTGTPRPWNPKSDPLVRAAIRDFEAFQDDPDYAELEFDAEGEVVRASREVATHPERALQLRSILEFEADPEDRHHLLQCLAHSIYGHEQQISQLCLGVCWQWWAEMFEIRRRARLGGAASVLDVLAPAMDCAEFVLEAFDEEREPDRHATLAAVFEEFLN